MRVVLTERFQRDLRGLTGIERARCLELLLALPRSVGSAHEHTGLGLRKIHASGVWEARLGLGLRLAFAFREGEVYLITIGSHDHVSRFLSSL